MTQLLSHLATAIEKLIAERGRPIIGAKLTGKLNGGRHKMFYIFHSLQSDMAFGVKKFFFANI